MRTAALVSSRFFLANLRRKIPTKTSYLSLGFTYLCLNPEPGCFASEDIWLDLKLDFVASYLERNFIAFGPELVLPLNIF